MRNAMLDRGARALGAAAMFTAALFALPAHAAAPMPTVTGPIAATGTPGDGSRNHPFFASNRDLAGRGFVEEEFFIEGTASRYATAGQVTGTVVDSGHPYRTRVVVRRPASAAAFSGTVLVEWTNVTNNMDMENTWFQIHEHVLRRGYAWVGVSAQRNGVNALRNWNPARYGSLDVSKRNALGAETITNDALSFEIFAQAVEAARGGGLLGGLVARELIATGHSQSAQRLSTYVNAIDPIMRNLDGFALHGSLATTIRMDLRVPVWKINSEFDVRALEARTRRADNVNFRTWEVAGTSHNDAQSYRSRVALQLRDNGTFVESALNCTFMPAGSTVPFHYAMSAGLDHLVKWIRTGEAMPSAPLLDLTMGPPVVLTRNALGLATGGIQLSQMSVPIAVSSGTNFGPGTCDRWGYTDLFDDETLDSLYRNHGSYVSKVDRATRENLARGFITVEDAEATIAAAAQSEVGKK